MSSNELNEKETNETQEERIIFLKLPDKSISVIKINKETLRMKHREKLLTKHRFSEVEAQAWEAAGFRLSEAEIWRDSLFIPQIAAKYKKQNLIRVNWNSRTIVNETLIFLITRYREKMQYIRVKLSPTDFIKFVREEFSARDAERVNIMLRDKEHDANAYSYVFAMQDQIVTEFDMREEHDT